MRSYNLVLLITIMVCCNTMLNAAEKVLYDFDDPKAAELEWVGNYKDNPELAVVGETTSNNFKLKMTFKGGDWPGFWLPVPQDWSSYQALHFEAYSAGPIKLTVRIDDPGSKDYHSRFHHTFKLKPGRNLCQIELKNVAEKLDIKQIKSAVLFCSNPPNGLVVELDNFVLGNIKGEKVPFIPYAERRDLQPKFDRVTPHFKYAKPLTGGPIKSFFLTSVLQGREVVEMAQRMDIEPSVQHWDPSYDSNTWGMGDFYGKRGHKTDYVLMQEYLASSMQGPEAFESMILFTPQGWERFGKSAQDAIVKRVREDGVGLVFVYPFSGVENGEWPESLKSINALIDSDSDYPTNNGYVRQARSGRVKGQKWSLSAEHPITRGVPLEALPFEKLTYQQYKVAPDATVLIQSAKGDPILAVRKVGNGRVATFAWRGRSLTPSIARRHGEGPVRSYRYQEIFYTLLNRASLWVAGRDLESTGKVETLKDESEHNLKVQVYKNAKGEISDWAMTFAPPGSSEVADLSVVSPEFVNYKDAITCSIEADDALKKLCTQFPEAAVTISLTEKALGQERTLLQEKKILKEINDGITVTFPSDKVAQIMAVLKVAVRHGDKLVAQGRDETIVTPDGPLWDDYEVMMWHNRGLAFLRELEDEMVTELGSTGIMETRWADAGLRMRYARAGLRLMVHDLARPQLQLRDFPNINQQFNKTNDDSLLIRKPSFADSDFLRKERQRVVDAVTVLKKFHPTNYILCDEPSITYYKFDYDFDFHPENIQRFKKALEQKFGTVENLNACLATNYKAFAEIYPVQTPQARKNNQWPLWNEWRQHNDNIMADAYKMYKEAVQEVHPQGTISLSGTQNATPFDGFDWSKLSPHFGSMQGYGYSDQERKRMSFADGMMINAVPAGYGRAGRAVDYQIWDSLTNHGGGHVLFWWIAFRNPDLTFCQSAYDYMRIFKEMKSGVGRQFLNAKREQSPVAMQYSMNSMRAAWTQGKDYHDACDATSRELVALGYDPIYISDEQIAAGELEKRGIKALFMPANYSIGQGKNQSQMNVLAGLTSFAQKGGLLFHRQDEVVDEFMRNPQSNILSFSTNYDSVDEKVASAISKVTKPVIRLSGASEAVLKKISVKVHKINGRDDARIVTVLRPPVGTKEVLGGDGVIHVVPDASGGNEFEHITVDLGALKPKHVYAMRSGKKIALTDASLDLKMQAGDGTPIVLLPYEISGLDVSCNKTAEGDVTVSCQLQGNDAYASHVVRISVMEGDQEDPVLSTNANLSGSGAVEQTIRLSIEDAQRELRIVVKDILSGTTSAPQLIK